METFIGLAIGLVVAVVAVLVVLQRTSVAPAAPANVAATPTLTAAEIRDVIREIHGETLRDLADQAKDDRQDAISTAATKVGEVIDLTKKQIDEKMGRLETEIRQ